MQTKAKALARVRRGEARGKEPVLKTRVAVPARHSFLNATRCWHGFVCLL